MANFGELRIGPAGWSYSDWQGIVYPSRRPTSFRELEFLAEFYDTVEINTSFYQPIHPGSAKQWLAQISANPRFRFSAKLWQKFTHQSQATTEDERSVRAGLDVLSDANRLGALLIQFPFSFHYNAENLTRLKKLVHSFQDYPVVLEIRHSSWDITEFRDALQARKIGIANIDQPLIGCATRPSEHATASLAYFRLHGRRYDTWFTDDPEIPRYERYNYLYSQAELQPWAERIGRVASRTKSTYIIMNNHYAGKGAVNALDLLYLLRREKLKVPEPLRTHYPHLEKIASQATAQGMLFHE